MHCAEIAKVAVEDTVYNFDKLFTYLIPDSLKPEIQPGCRVLVGFGNGRKLRQGFVFRILSEDFNDEDFVKLKFIDSLLDKKPVLNEDILSLAEFCSQRTFCTFFEAAKAALPSGMCLNLIETYIVNPEFNFNNYEMSADECAVFNFIKKKNGYVRNDLINKNFGFSIENKVIENLYNIGALLKNTDSVRKIGDFTIKSVAIKENIDELTDGLKLTSKQKSVIGTLRDIGCSSVKELCYFTGVTSAVIENLAKKGFIDIFEEESYRKPSTFSYTVTDKDVIQLSQMQYNAYEKLKNLYNEDNYNFSLLYGVTGSGKTKVYMKLIDDMYLSCNSVIVMVPEISLTPQLLDSFYSRYGDKVAVLHSALSYGERLDEWKRIKEGKANIVIGTRSAVFAPVKNLSLIIIDEEQESTYKSEMTPRYNTKDLAKYRCVYSKALLVLASATPSVESFAYAINNRYNLVEITERYSESGLPEVKTIDISDKNEIAKGDALSKALCNEIEKNLNNKEQTILLINRRGYNTFVSCSGCKSVITCPNCSISLTYHNANNRLMCHYCGYSQPLVNVCPKCGSDTVKYSGFGTQKVEEELLFKFPQARILRMDADTVTRKNSHEKKFGDFADGNYDIMIGTQMVAKGLNFPNVTLVGVISVDQQLYDDDFRSVEKTFDLLTQVVGRSGRGEKHGRAVIQTISPENVIISYASKQNYEMFFNDEIRIRKGLIYPPYCDICVIGFTGINENLVKTGALHFLSLLKEKVLGKYQNEKLVTLGPVEPKASKLNSKYRQRIIIKCKNSNNFRKLISECLKCFMNNSKYKNVSVYADINPESTF